jgi:hypothetical protein
VRQEEKNQIDDVLVGRCMGSRSKSHTACSGSRLSAITTARLAASRRPWPARMVPASSIRIGWRTIDGHSAGDVTRDDVLDDITLYWLTNTAISSARLYWGNKVAFTMPSTSPSRLL